MILAVQSVSALIFASTVFALCTVALFAPKTTGFDPDRRPVIPWDDAWDDDDDECPNDDDTVHKSRAE